MKDKMYPVVCLKFKDHAQSGSSEQVQCKIWGLLVSQDEEYYYIHQWVTNGDLSDEENNDVSSIMIECVSEIWEFGMDTID